MDNAKEGGVLLVCLEGEIVERLRLSKVTRGDDGAVVEVRGVTLDTIPGRKWEFGRVNGEWKKSFLPDPATPYEPSYSERGPTFELHETSHS